MTYKKINKSRGSHSNQGSSSLDCDDHGFSFMVNATAGRVADMVFDKIMQRLEQIDTSEMLINDKVVAERLGISKTTFFEHKKKLMTYGLKEIRGAGTVRYLASSLDAVLQKAARTGKPLY